MTTNRWVVSPEVAGQLGENTVMDSSVHPPRVFHLHHRFEGWMGDELLEAFPCFLVSDGLATTLEEAKLEGFSLAEVEVSVSPEFQERLHGPAMPQFRWLKITGQSRKADFWITPDFRLEVSEAALAVLNKFKLSHAVLETANSQA